ncbi:cholecystokinin receptor type A-like [Biomphalaria glabrata]|uniref:Cholecystokinin receptor type A-like n=1 Tax=Biomphalaria glabrata TaxID=6526 RepID=A0A2C9JY91_BIOGL|nr:cholecystokinin receptor type A-like [Biomphalaria glabrata]XP_055867884.1 cholecystokinin receptor type A-like [Biomphalaria glabrata]XP_055867885.1 cholecystokinin receptor type A-like [Biomphalaria glabrata]XP_055867886.1 cholecystokinin receptor type A-like [Biomphalaria glabrata]XP_055867887.1 cholecystokinin receptor type A-like [Biomphalaria glabrata]XP_055867888.1 cholecystokinin receptor type A-like [Biomphalaria glabrata]KAI8733660.1 cholecystokinin receptor type A-like [Biomphal
MDASDRLSTLSYNEQPPSNLSLASSGISNNTAFILVLKNIFLVSTPTICVTAVTGNVLAFFVFVSKSLRRTSCSWYLAARSVSDSGFLIFNFLSWLSETFSLNFIHLAGMCQVFVFFTYLFSFLSVWLTVVVTLENYVRICRPFSVQKFCNTLIARNTILVLVSVGILLYNFPFWVNVSVATSYGNSTLVWCKFKDEFKAFMKAVLFVDTLTTLVVPSILIVVLMVAITFSLIKSLKRQSRLQGVGSRSACTNGETGGGGRSRSKSSPQAKVTRMLFAVSFFFILLNGPSHFIRAYRVFLPVNPTPVNQTSADHQTLSPGVEEQAQVFCEMIYYLCFAVNLVIYLTFGRSFRKQFKETYFSYCLRHNSPSGCSEMTAMSTVRLEEIENRNEDQAALIEPNANKDNNNTGS